MQQEPNHKHLLALLWGMVVFFLASSVPALTERATLKSLGYETKSLSRMTPSTEFWFEIPGNWSIQDPSNFELVISHPKTEDEGTGALRVSVNSQVVVEEKLGSKARDHETFIVPLPSGEPTPQGFHVVVEYLARGVGNHCFAPDPRPLVVRATSRFSVNYELRPAYADFAELPYPFAYKRSREPIPLTYVLNPENVWEVDAAANLSAHFAQHAGSSLYGVRTVIRRSQRQLGWKNLKGRNVLSIQELGKPQLCGGAHSIPTAQLCLRPDRKDLAVLSISYSDQANLDKIIGTLRLSTTLSGQSLTDFTGKQEKPQSIWAEGKITLSDFDVSTFELKGLGKLEKNFHFPRPKGWQLGPSSSFSLHLSAGELGEDYSSYEIKVNDQSIGSGKFSELDSGWVELPFPDNERLNRKEDGLAQDVLLLTIVLHHGIDKPEESDCDPRQDRVYTTIHDDSFFKLRPVFPELPELLWFPYPFSSSDEVALVLSSPLDEDHVAAGIAVAAEIGRASLTPVEFISSASVDAPILLAVVDLDSPEARRIEGLYDVNLSRPSLPDGAPFEVVVGQLQALHSLKRESNALVVEADPEQASTVAFALGADPPSSEAALVSPKGVTVSVQSTRGTVRMAKRAAMGAFNWILEFRPSFLEVILLVLCAVFIVLWRTDRLRQQPTQEFDDDDDEEETGSSEAERSAGAPKPRRLSVIGGSAGRTVIGLGAVASAAVLAFVFWPPTQKAQGGDDQSLGSTEQDRTPQRTASVAVSSSGPQAAASVAPQLSGAPPPIPSTLLAGASVATQVLPNPGVSAAPPADNRGRPPKAQLPPTAQPEPPGSAFTAPNPSANAMSSSLPKQTPPFDDQTQVPAPSAPTEEPTPEPSPDPMKLPGNRAWLYYASDEAAQVYVHGVARGPTNEWMMVPCGVRFIRLGHAPGQWLAPGSATRLRCRSTVHLGEKQ